MVDTRPATGPEAWQRAAPLLFDARRWEEAEAEVDGLVALAGLAPGAAVLDLCCGPGRHALALARRGFQVTGVDITPAFLDEAGRRAADAGADLELVHADMGDFERAGAFDAVVNLATSFGWFDDPADDDAVLAHVAASLRPGGALVMELLSREVVANHPRAPVLAEEGGITLVAAQRVRPGGEWVEHYVSFVSAGSATAFTFANRLYSAGDVTAALARQGFEDVQRYGDFAGGPHDASAQRLVVVGRRPA